jgi:hypothetical protein
VAVAQDVLWPATRGRQAATAFHALCVGAPGGDASGLAAIRARLTFGTAPPRWISSWVYATAMSRGGVVHVGLGVGTDGNGDMRHLYLVKKERAGFHVDAVGRDRSELWRFQRVVVPVYDSRVGLEVGIKGRYNHGEKKNRF